MAIKPDAWKAFSAKTKGAWARVRNEPPERRVDSLDGPPGSYVGQLSKVEVHLDKNRNPIIRFVVVILKCVGTNELPYKTLRGETLNTIEEVSEHVHGKVIRKTHFITPPKPDSKLTLDDKIRMFKDDVYCLTPEEEYGTIAELDEKGLFEYLDQLSQRKPKIVIGVQPRKDAPELQNFYFNQLAADEDEDANAVDRSGSRSGFSAEDEDDIEDAEEEYGEDEPETEDTDDEDDLEDTEDDAEELTPRKPQSKKPGLKPGDKVTATLNTPQGQKKYRCVVKTIRADGTLDVVRQLDNKTFSKVNPNMVVPLNS
ncbi:MAG: hypothetical protein QXT45_04830 [Candidatus Bilamarchaeaceae archaeon]